MGALNQPSDEEIERRRAARALYALGWLLVCLALHEIIRLHRTVFEYIVMLPLMMRSLRGPSPSPNLEPLFLEILQTHLPWMLVTGAMACAAFMAAKGVECRQQWARILGIVVAIFAMVILPGKILLRAWSLNAEAYGEIPIWHLFLLYEFWTVLAVPCLILGATALWAMWRRRRAEVESRGEKQ